MTKYVFLYCFLALTFSAYATSLEERLALENWVSVLSSNREEVEASCHCYALATKQKKGCLTCAGVQNNAELPLCDRSHWEHVAIMSCLDPKAQKNKYADMTASEFFEDIQSLLIQDREKFKKDRKLTLNNYLIFGNSSIQDADVVFFGETHNDFEMLLENIRILNLLIEPHYKEILLLEGLTAKEKDICSSRLFCLIDYMPSENILRSKNTILRNMLTGKGKVWVCYTAWMNLAKDLGGTSSWAVKKERRGGKTCLALGGNPKSPNTRD